MVQEEVLVYGISFISFCIFPLVLAILFVVFWRSKGNEAKSGKFSVLDISSFETARCSRRSNNNLAPYIGSMRITENGFSYNLTGQESTVDRSDIVGFSIRTGVLSLNEADIFFKDRGLISAITIGFQEKKDVLDSFLPFTRDYIDSETRGTLFDVGIAYKNAPKKQSETLSEQKIEKVSIVDFNKPKSWSAHSVGINTIIISDKAVFHKDYLELFLNTIISFDKKTSGPLLVIEKRDVVSLRISENFIHFELRQDEDLPGRVSFAKTDELVGKIREAGFVFA